MQVVPESSRATIYNLFRVPLNAIVLAVLLNDMSVSTAFLWTSLMLFVAGVCQSVLIKRMARNGSMAVPGSPCDAERDGSHLLEASDKDY